MFPPLAKSSHRRNTGAHRSPAAQSSLLVVQNRAGKLPPLRIHRTGRSPALIASGAGARAGGGQARGQAGGPRFVIAQVPKPTRTCASPPGTPSLRNRAGSKNKTEPALFPRCAFKTAHEAKSSSFASRGFREGNARGQAFARTSPRCVFAQGPKPTRPCGLREGGLNREPLGSSYQNTSGNPNKIGIALDAI
jgi:hypothetical protein